VSTTRESQILEGMVQVLPVNGQERLRGLKACHVEGERVVKANIATILVADCHTRLAFSDQPGVKTALHPRALGSFK